MLVYESRFTPLTNDIKNQIKRLINTFVKNYVERKGKSSNLTLDQAKQNVKKMLNQSEGKEIKIGDINLGKELNRYIPVFIKETGSGGTYYQEGDEYHEHIVIAFDTIFGKLENILSVLAHEIIHAIQKYKNSSNNYGNVANRIVKGDIITNQENFIYYTEPHEFEAQASELAYNIIRFYEKRSVDKEKVLFVLDNVLKFPKRLMFKFFNSFFLRYLINLSDKEQDLLNGYLREMFLYKIEFLKTIAKPPDDRPINIKKSDRYWRQFKQKLFNLVQILKKRHLKTSRKE